MCVILLQNSSRCNFLSNDAIDLANGEFDKIDLRLATGAAMCVHTQCSLLYDARRLAAATDAGLRGPGGLRGPEGHVAA